MKKQIATPVLPLVNNKEALDGLLYYINYRIDVLKDNLTVVSTYDEILKIQGTISELKRMKNVRDEIINAED